MQTLIEKATIGDHVFLAEPLAEIHKLAAARAEGPKGAANQSPHFLQLGQRILVGVLMGGATFLCARDLCNGKFEAASLGMVPRSGFGGNPDFHLNSGRNMNFAKGRTVLLPKI